MPERRLPLHPDVELSPTSAIKKPDRLALIMALMVHSERQHERGFGTGCRVEMLRVYA
ncbi:MAG: hypothetical protein V4623_11145 [Pseudomonadota bacterium]